MAQRSQSTSSGLSGPRPSSAFPGNVGSAGRSYESVAYSGGILLFPSGTSNCCHRIQSEMLTFHRSFSRQGDLGAHGPVMVSYEKSLHGIAVRTESHIVILCSVCARKQHSVAIDT